MTALQPPAILDAVWRYGAEMSGPGYTDNGELTVTIAEALPLLDDLLLDAYRQGVADFTVNPSSLTPQ